MPKVFVGNLRRIRFPVAVIVLVALGGWLYGQVLVAERKLEVVLSDSVNILGVLLNKRLQPDSQAIVEAMLSARIAMLANSSQRIFSDHDRIDSSIAFGLRCLRNVHSDWLNPDGPPAIQPPSGLFSDEVRQTQSTASVQTHRQLAKLLELEKYRDDTIVTEEASTSE